MILGGALAIFGEVMQLAAAAGVVSILFVVLHLLEKRISGLVAPDVFLLGLSPLENLMLFWAVLLGVGLSLFLIVKGTMETHHMLEGHEEEHSIGTITFDYPPTEPVLAVTSHDNAALTTAVFENVAVRNHVMRQFAAIFGGMAPLICTALVAWTGSLYAVAGYVVVIALICAL